MVCIKYILISVVSYMSRFIDNSVESEPVNTSRSADFLQTTFWNAFQDGVMTFPYYQSFVRGTTGGFPSQRASNAGFYVCFDVSLNKWAVCTTHDDVMTWKHFLHHLPFVKGIHRWPVNSLHKGSNTELWCFLWCWHEETIEQTCRSLRGLCHVTVFISHVIISAVLQRVILPACNMYAHIPGVE